MCRWCATYRWKALNKGYNFALNLISIEGLHTKLWGPKVVEVSTLGICLDVGVMDKHRTYYKGEGGGLPQVQVVVSLVSSNLPMARPSTKSIPTMH